MKRIFIIATVAVAVIGFIGCSKKENKKVSICKKELKVIEKHLDNGKKNALNELVEWESRCKKIVNTKLIKKGGLEPNPSNDKNF